MHKKGHDLRTQLIRDYGSEQNNGEKLSRWNSLHNDWITDTYNKLEDIYSSPIEPLNFLNNRSISLSIGMQQDFGNIIVDIEGRVKLLSEMYKFIFEKSNININAKGDVIFQYGDDNKAEQKS